MVSTPASFFGGALRDDLNNGCEGVYCTGALALFSAYRQIIIDIEDITWPRRDTKFLFEC